MIRNTLAALAVGGLVVGLYLLNGASPTNVGPRGDTSADAVTQQVAQTRQAPVPKVTIPGPPDDLLSHDTLREELTALQLENDSLKNQMGDVLNWILSNFRGRYPLKESALSHLNLPPIDENFALHPDLADFLNISTDEKFLVEDAFDFTRGNLRVLQDQNLSVTSPTPAQVMITFNQFPEAGQALRNDLLAALEVSLGTDRLDRLLTVSENSLDSAFDYFGQASRTLMFEIVLDETDNQMKLVVNDGWFNEQDPNQLVYSEKESVVATLPVQYNDFQYLLPETFTPFVKIQ